MKQLFLRGKRIRPTDKDLVFHTALAALFPVFLLVVLLFHIRQIAGTNWQEVSLSQIAQDVNIPYLLFSMGVAGLVCLAVILLFWRYRRDEVKQLIHRQKLARMVLENRKARQQEPLVSNRGVQIDRQQPNNRAESHGTQGIFPISGVCQQGSESWHTLF